MTPSPSVSISAIMRLTSSPVTEPRVLSASPSSAAEIFPSPLASNRLKIRSLSALAIASSAIVSARVPSKPFLPNFSRSQEDASKLKRLWSKT
ncbi:uncharacterized protein J3R85_020726 [Psidium guajava]|nr:uncharacterized protein J3R85_020726 [Psidium guajava]